MVKTKQPYCFEINDGELFAFAGLWDRWRDPGGNSVETCSITVGIARQCRLSQDVVSRAREALLRALLRDLQGGGIEQCLLLARLFLDTDRIDELIDMATSSAELVREHGAHGDPRQDGIEEVEGSHRADADEVEQCALHPQVRERFVQALEHPITNRPSFAYVVVR